MNGHIVLIAGGMDKGSNFNELIESFKNKVVELILLGETSEIIKEIALKNSDCNVTIVKNMKEAVSLSYKRANDGDVVLLSPACASWDMYESFEHRGREFKELVSDLC